MIHIITGQTATGKTNRAIELAQKLNGEVINADARQIYKKLDIITGKDLALTTGKFTLSKQFQHKDIGYYEIPNSRQQTRQHAHPSIQSEMNVRLWLYDIIDPSYSFSAVEYAELAMIVIEDILSRGKTPIIVGGTYFYLKQLLYNSVQTRVPPDEDLRQMLSTKSTTELQQILSSKNLILFRSLNNSERSNPQRLIRKIEIEMAEHKQLAPPTEGIPYEFEIEGYYFDSKSYLRERISTRVEERLESGAIEEVQKLVHDGYSAESPGFATIGYREVLEYLEGNLSLKELKHAWITKEVQYAKRQLTFMKRDENIVWNTV